MILRCFALSFRSLRFFRVSAALLIGVVCQTSLLACSVVAPSGPRFTVSEPIAFEPFETDASAHGRDAGFSVRIGDRVLWLFGDTFPNEELMLSATAAWSEANDPVKLLEPTDADGNPTALFDYSPSETAFNAAHAEPPSCCAEFAQCPPEQPTCRCDPGTDCSTRIALWPGSAVPVDAGSAIGFNESVEVGLAPWTFDVLGVGTATLMVGGVRARRSLDGSGEPRLVFTAGEPKFLHALRVDHGNTSWVYVFGETEPDACMVDVYVGRVQLSRIADRSGYRFWDGQDWVESIESAGPAVAGVVGGLGSVIWNEYLGVYLSGTIGLCTDGGRFLLRSARQPEGPWSEPLVIDLATVGADGEAYAGLLHESLSRGRRLVLSFYQPLVRDERAYGSVRLVEVELERSGAVVSGRR